MRKTSKTLVRKNSRPYHNTEEPRNGQKYFWGIGDDHRDEVAMLATGREFDVDLLDAIFDGAIAEV